MIATHYIPCPPLAAFVKVLWYWDGYLQPHKKERLLPDGSMTIVFNLGEDRIHFYEPGDPPRSGTMRGHVLCGAHSLEEVFGVSARGVRDQLLDCTNPQQMFAAVEQWLLSRLAKPLQRHAAVEYATQQFLRNPIAQPLTAVLGRIGYSQRHFNQLFSAEVGLTPKRFLRVRRFQSAISSIACCDSVDWAGLALRCGYYDQAHFVHDFRSFSGLTPAAYLGQRTPHLNHVPMLE
jgi:AraC-like DNA-binding protein